MGMAYIRTKQLQEAQSAFEKAVDLNPKFLNPYFPLAELLIANKQFDKAAPLLQQAMVEDSQDWRWPYELAFCSARQGQWEEAVEYGQVALRRPNSATKVHLLLADVYSNSGKVAKAVEELEEFERLDPQSPYIGRVREVLPQLRLQASSRDEHP